jgi:glycosyltransferase involved in cell wall biosynthesis
MKIAFFCDAYLPTKNGVATSARTTAEELRRLGHRVVIFAPRYTDYEDTDPDVVRFAAGHWFKARDYPVAWPFLSRIAPRTAHRFRKERFDIVHVHSPFILGGLGAYWATFHFIPLAWTFHTLYHHYGHYSITPPRASRLYILMRVRQMLRRCDRVIAPSHAIDRIIQKVHPGTNTRVLPTGVDIPRFAKGDGLRARQELGIGPDERVLVYCGRVVQEKNIGFLLRAVAPILKSPPGGRSTRLVLVGGGPNTEVYKELAEKLGIASRVHLTGFAEGQRLTDFYHAGDIFTFASRTETQGLAIAEAMCAGLPPVVVNAMGAPETVRHGENGLIVPASEVRFREAVAQLLTDEPLRQRLAARALASAPGFSRECRVRELLDLYEEMIQETEDRSRNPFTIV